MFFFLYNSVSAQWRINLFQSIHDNQNCEIGWPRTSETTTFVASSTPRPSLLMGWEMTHGYSIVIALSKAHDRLKTNLFPAAPRRTCRAIQEENHSHHCQPLPIHQNQNTGSKIICLDLMHYKISIFWLAAYCFSKVAHQKQIILTPIEVAIEDIQMKVNQSSKYEQQLLCL